MKLNIKKLVSKADDEIFDDIIGKCEEKMVSPFKKEVAVEVEPEVEENEAEESSKSNADLDPEDLQKLLEMWQNLKG